MSPVIIGQQLDLLARRPLFADGLDYLHGTGHGVGAFLNVHESPPGVNRRATGSGGVTLQPGMIFSDEPGYYETGSFGIRIESLLLCNPVKTLHLFHHKHYLGFENLTPVPFCRKLIDVDLLNEDQIRYIDQFHAECRRRVEPVLAKHRDARALAFLHRETRPLRSVAMGTMRMSPVSLVAVASGAALLGAAAALWWAGPSKP